MRTIEIVIINLDRDKERLIHMRDQLEKHKLEFTRFPAVEGLKVPSWLKQWFFDESGKPTSNLKAGEIGVYASHLALHKMLLARDDLDALLIMEDDLEIGENFPNILNALSQIELSFDIIKLSNPPKSPCISKCEIINGLELVIYSRIPNNMGAYLISKSGALKTTKFRGMCEYAIDEDMRHPWNWELETYGIAPAPIKANIFEKSSIDAIGSRNLGRESWLDKIKRRHWETPSTIIRRFSWQLRCLTIKGYLSCILRILSIKCYKILGFRNKISENSFIIRL